MDQSISLGATIAQKADATWALLTSASIRTQLYVGGAVLLLLGMLSAIPDATRLTSKPLIAVGSACLAAAVTIECYYLVLRTLETPIGKLGATLTGAAAVPIALGISSNIVNEATGQAPSHFPYAVGMIAPLTAGYFIVIASGLVVLVGMLLGIPTAFSAIFSRRGGIDRDTAKFFARLLGGFCLFALVNAAWKHGSPVYENALRWVARGAVYHLDMYPMDPCSKGERTRVRRITDEIVVVAMPAGRDLKFARQSCPLASRG